MKDNFKKPVIQILLVMVIVVGIITLFKSGYNMGHWLYISTHTIK